MRCAEQLGRRGGHIHRLHGRRRVGQVRSGLEEDSVEERLELWGLERMAPVVGREEGRDERDAQVRDSEVIRGHQRSSEGSSPHVKHVILALNEVRAGVLRGMCQRRKPMNRGHLAALDTRAARKGRVLEPGHVEALRSVIIVEDELGVFLGPRVLCGEAPDVGVEEELIIVRDVAVACSS